jgi:hypothetical protein
MKTTEERMVEACTIEVRKALGLSPPPGGGYGYVPSAADVFLCRELDDIRGQLENARAQLGMLNVPSQARSTFAMPGPATENVFIKATADAIRKIRAQGLEPHEVELFTEEVDGRILLRWRKRSGE